MPGSAHGAEAVLTIDLDAIGSNYRLLQARVGGKPVAPMVKADAYGLGVHRVAPALWREGARLFFVAQLSEAIELREILPAEAEIAVLNGLFAGEETAFAEARAMPVLNDLGQLELWDAWCRQHGPAPAVLHIDTGLTRLGLEPHEVDRLAGSPELAVGIPFALVMSHLACADTPEHPLNQQQLTAFNGALNRLSAVVGDVPRSLAASSGIFLSSAFHFDVARPGAALYGLRPQENVPNPMACCVQLRARILQIRHVDSPMTVGYGATHSIRGPGLIATIAVGYADGLLRASGGRGHAVLGGCLVPMVGRVSMDLITLDVSNAPEHLVQPGQWVELIGRDIPPDHVADAAGTIGYEILTSLGGRYERRYMSGGDEGET